MEFPQALFKIANPVPVPVYRNNLPGQIAVTVDVHNTRDVLIDMYTTSAVEPTITISLNERRSATYKLRSGEEVFLKPQAPNGECWVKITAHTFPQSLA
jgi:hypothetical protein